MTKSLTTDLSRETAPLGTEELSLVDAWWRAANYLAVGMIYLQDNPCCANRLSRSTSRTGCSATGARVLVRRSSGPTPTG